MQLPMSTIQRLHDHAAPMTTGPTTADAPGQLLRELEARQNEAMRELDRLEAQLASVMKGLDIEMEPDPDLLS